VFWTILDMINSLPLLEWTKISKNK
jgi:hypothetical protein